MEKHIHAEECAIILNITTLNETVGRIKTIAWLSAQALQRFAHTEVSTLLKIHCRSAAWRKTI